MTSLGVVCSVLTLCVCVCDVLASGGTILAGVVVVAVLVRASSWGPALVVVVSGSPLVVVVVTGYGAGPVLEGRGRSVFVEFVCLLLLFCCWCLFFCAFFSKLVATLLFFLFNCLSGCKFAFVVETL